MLASKHLVSCSSSTSSSSPSGRRIVQVVHYMTAEKWLQEADFQLWLKIDGKDGLLEKIWCSMMNRLRKFSRSFRSFIDGITDPGRLKRDQVSKHRKFEQQMRAIGMYTNPFTHADLYRQTAIRKTLVTPPMFCCNSFKLDQFLYYITQ